VTDSREWADACWDNNPPGSHGPQTNHPIHWAWLFAVDGNNAGSDSVQRWIRQITG
jgi:hypothetical protein